MITDEDILNDKAKLLGSLLLFTQVMYKIRTGRDFLLSEPISRESHFISVSRELTKVFNREGNRLCINIPPRYGKSELLIHFVAWSLAHYPDSNFLYISYSQTLAKKQTQTIREIITLPHYKKLFGVEISHEVSAKDNFETTVGGSVYAAGAAGTITGRGAGVKNVERFGGALLFDDMHKPDEVHSDTMREAVINWYYNTAQSRLNNGSKTPIIAIGQRTHEQDIFGHFETKSDWDYCIIPALGENGQALYPEMHSREELLKMQLEDPYHFAAQYMQNPQPAGGGIFKPEWFVQTDREPEILGTFITADTAETDKTYNDASAFSFWGIYRIRQGEVETELYGLHWLSCLEVRVEPKDLQAEFMNFYYGCMRHPKKPKLIILEKKSTGVTLTSILNELQGLEIVDFPRLKSKTDRFLACQRYLASKCVSFTRYSAHVDKCIEHCRKITANQSHAHDDIADTLADAVSAAFIDKIALTRIEMPIHSPIMASTVMEKFKQVSYLKNKRYGNVW